MSMSKDEAISAMWRFAAMAGLTHGLLCLVFRAFGILPWPTKKGTRMSDMIAFLIVAGYCCIYLAVAGCIGFFSDEQTRLNADPFYSHSDFYVEHLAIPMFGYQVWNLIASFIHPDLRVVEMYVHHSLAAMLAYFSLHPYSHGFGFFFFGLVEISNFPLNFVDLCDHFEGRPIAKKLVTFNLVCKVVFAICFIVFRLVMWPILSVDMWIGSYQLLMSGNAHSNVVVMFFALGNIALTLLQFYWGWKIFGVAFEMFCKKKEKVAEVENGGSAPAKKQK